MLLIIYLALLCVWLYVFFRNSFVYDVSINMIQKDYDKYKRLPSHYQMLFKYFWIWDKDKFPLDKDKEYKFKNF